MSGRNIAEKFKRLNKRDTRERSKIAESNDVDECCRGCILESALNRPGVQGGSSAYRVTVCR